MKKTLAALLIISGACLSGSAIANQSDWTTENVYKAIVTEAVGEGPDGMRYVASCFWNRRTYGLDLGSVGARRADVEDFVEKQSLHLRELAHQLAVRVVDGEGSFDLVNGATQFESTDFQAPEWVRDGEYRSVFKYRHHIFYRKVS